ncbi:hypothetical protein CL176_02805 [Suicoccus acidiformans]|uniref:Transporter n=1 Tax=Suicoccus acidiformans TaxID=2036206 RepID=A0A347WIY5_9LACT|nr:AEC family transporter [Suicoccus acidiformans]AXY25042.1 hypothetical protein CL176_02805 [Suicoccus acidiformans]
MQLDFFLTLQRVLVLFLLIIIGFFAGKAKLISPKGQQDITNLVLYITMPATIFLAMQLEYQPERLQKAGSIIAIVGVCYLLMFLFGLITSKFTFLNLDDAQQDVYRVACLLSNTSFMGYPIVQSLLGDEALFYAVIGAGFIFEIVSWTLGIYMIGRRSTGTVTFNWKKIVFSPGILSILIGLLFFVNQWAVPEPVYSVLTTLSPATSPLAMIVVGLILSRSDIKAAFQNSTLYFQSFIKLLFVPVIILFTLKALGFTDYELIIPVIMLAMPTASYVAMFSANYDNNPQFASQMVFMTSLLSIITIPVITLLF